MCNRGVCLGHGSRLLQLRRRTECVVNLKLKVAEQTRAEHVPVVCCNRMHHKHPYVWQASCHFASCQ